MIEKGEKASQNDAVLPEGCFVKIQTNMEIMRPAYTSLEPAAISLQLCACVLLTVHVAWLDLS